jgi:hypothetical protein
MSKFVSGLAASGVNRTVENNRAYEETRRALLQEKDVFPVLPKFLSECHTLQDVWAFIHTRFGLLSHPAQRLDWVRQQFLSALDALENDRLPTQMPAGQKFFPPGTPHDGFITIREIISATKQSLLIADNFVDKTLWPLLANLPQGTSIRILTKSAPADFGVEAQNFAKQYGMAVEVRVTNVLHDRFVVCDNKRCSHLGASVKDFGVKAALISDVVGDSIASAVRNELEAIWQASKPF